MKALNPKIVLVTRPTRLAQLKQRFNTARQAKYWVEHMGQSFDVYEAEADAYSDAQARLSRELGELGRPVQTVDRGRLPSYLFTPDDVVVTVGQDGLVVNTAKYLNGQPIVAVNPDPTTIDGILLPFTVDRAAQGTASAIAGTAAVHEVTMAEARLNDGQQLLAFNDFLIGQRSHVSARYRLSFAGNSEEQSSSGVLVSTGAGSTGWFSSTLHMARAVGSLLGNRAPAVPPMRIEWSDRRLVFVVREPFASRATGVNLTAGLIEPGEELRIESRMSEGGVIFSDGVESDAIAFNAGNVVTIRTADRVTRLVKGERSGRSHGHGG